MKVAVLYGGLSREREISIRSGNRVYKALIKLGYNAELIDVDENFVKNAWKLKEFDVAFIMLHGRYGEDGTIQGILEYLRIPYVGSGVLSSALCFNKLKAYEILKDKLTLPKFITVERPTDSSPFGFPCFIKPIDEGSSIGAHICRTGEELYTLLKRELKFYKRMFLMEYIKGRELTVSMIEKDDNIVILPILELRPKKEFYDYEAKYTKGMTEFILPAPLNSKEKEDVERAALTAYKSLGCSSFGRMDGILKDGKFYFLELNSIPGMTQTSDLPASALEAGMSFEELVDILLKTASLKG